MVNWREEAAFPTEEQQALALQDGQALFLMLGSCWIDMGIPEGVRATLLGEQGEEPRHPGQKEASTDMFFEKTGRRARARRGGQGAPGESWRLERL